VRATASLCSLWRRYIFSRRFSLVGVAAASGAQSGLPPLAT